MHNIFKLINLKKLIFSSFGQMIRPIIDSMSVRPSGGTSVSHSASSLQEPESIFEPRDSASGGAEPREQPDGWSVLCYM